MGTKPFQLLKQTLRLTSRKRCHGRARPEALLLPTYDHDTRRPYREASKVRHCDGNLKMPLIANHPLRYTPDGRNEKKQRLNESA